MDDLGFIAALVFIAIVLFGLLIFLSQGAQRRADARRRNRSDR